MELLIATAILVLLTGISVPFVSSAVEAYRLRGAAWQLAGDLRLARQRAISMQKRHRLCFMNCAASVAVNTYVFERDDGAAGAPVWVRESQMPLALPAGVSVDASQTSGNATTRGRVVFDVKGDADAFGTLRVGNGAGRYDIKTSSHGRVLVCKGECP
jgi:Tfp pilus assembly protein FimT